MLPLFLFETYFPFSDLSHQIVEWIFCPTFYQFNFNFSHFRKVTHLFYFFTGKWSSNIPTCDPILCPPIETTSTHLIVHESNLTYGGEAVFRCQWGYVLQGVEKIYCQMNGRWSSPIPTCLGKFCLPIQYEMEKGLIRTALWYFSSPFKS